MGLLWRYPVGLVFLALIGCSSQPFDANAESRMLLKRDAEWADTAAAGRDVEKTVSYWADDATVVPPDQPVVRGRAAIHDFVFKNFHTPGFHIHWKSQSPIFSDDGKLAYLFSATTTSVPGPNGTAQTFRSRALTVWRRDSDGQWRCIVDIWNDGPTGATSEK